MGAVRFKVWDADYEASVATLRDALGEQDFDSAWAEGAALSTEEAIAYAQRGRGERKRPASGWDSLTPTERDVVQLVSGGLGNKDIATRLFVSPRTVQTHLTHVYTKLGLTSRVQLVQEAARHMAGASMTPDQLRAQATAFAANTKHMQPHPAGLAGRCHDALDDLALLEADPHATAEAKRSAQALAAALQAALRAEG
jgi:DNA-binding CsgD family transcriptional regulator